MHQLHCRNVDYVGIRSTHLLIHGIKMAATNFLRAKTVKGSNIRNQGLFYVPVILISEVFKKKKHE